MTEQCTECSGTGILASIQQECPECKGSGKPKSMDLTKMTEKDLGSLMQGGAKCQRCSGSGKITIEKKCQACGGRGEILNCQVCGKPLGSESDGELCVSCAKKPLVHKLSPACDTSDLEIGKIYEGDVDSLANFGAFVNLNAGTRGLVHQKNITRSPEAGDQIFVEVKSIASNGNIDLVPASLTEYQIIQVEKDIPRIQISALNEHVGKLVHISGEVIQVKQTGGPTIFTIADETGTAPSAAFEKAGQRAYPEIESDMIVKVIGELRARNNELQIEIREIRQLWGADSTTILEEIEKAIDTRSEPHVTEFLVESQIMEALRPKMRQVAKEIRKAIYHSRPIVMRHHADADGITSAIAIEKAIIPLIKEVGGSDAGYHFYRRSPSKAPFYEMVDITKDISFATSDSERHGQKMPLIILMDNGSTEEDVPAMLQAKVYGMDMVVVDHHHPDDVVDQYLLAHVNPAHEGGDFGITTGMLGTEIARMINPDVTDEIRHLPAVSAVGDRSEAPEAEKYISLVSSRYNLDDLKNMAMALDYEAFWLRFDVGKGIMYDILNLGNLKRHRQLVPLLVKQAKEAIENQLEASMSGVKTQKLPNGALLNVLDVENFAHKFTFPPPGKTSGEVHDRLCKQTPDKPIITLGYGPDFAVLRSRGVLMNIPQMVRELREEIPGASVNGGGHLVVGSIKFVGGMRKEVLARLAEKMGKVEVSRVS
ncbi:MAG: DHH family phosphoesterase [Methanosarcinales archaeon]|nr:DHH family phosphoesterase [Methanosarcinales archaeon]